MKIRTILALTLPSLFVATGLVAAAQAAAPPPPPNVLVIQREYLKPGKSGAIHVKSEANFVKASNDAKWPTHYIAMDSLSGPTRALYILAYDSFDAYGKDQEAQSKNPSYAAAIDAASLSDGELLTRYDSQAYAYHPEMSLHAAVEVPHQRYWEITSFHIKPGHDKEWADLVKIYTDGFAKFPEAHWAVFESKYGEDNGGVWISINPMRSLNEIDKGMADGKSFAAALGDAGMQHAGELAASCIQSVQTNLFVVNVKESYPDASWAQAAPELWGQQ
jgi:hypothetical protein